MNEWLDGVFGTVRCANCGAVYGRDSVAVVGNREDHWFVRCACQACGTQGLGVVIVKRVADAPPLVVPRAVFSAMTNEAFVSTTCSKHTTCCATTSAT